MTYNIKLLKSYILYLLTGLLITFVGISNVFGLTYIDIGDKADITVVLVSTDYANSPFTVPKNSSYNFAQVLEVDYIVSNYNFEANKNYQLESHLTNQTFTNANYYTVQGANGEQCLISYDNSVFTGNYPRWAFQCPHATNTITLSISNSAHEYLWNSGIYTWTTALLKYSDTSLSSGTGDSDSIINNQNQNTQSIINNQNQNTQDIINNQNQNTQNIIDSNKVCEIIDINDKEYNGYLMNNGQVLEENTSIVTTYFTIDENSEIIKVDSANTDGYYRLCFYNSNKDFISCLRWQDYNTLDIIPIPDNSKFVRFTINASTKVPKFKICKDGNQAVNDSITDDSIDTSDADDFFSSFSDNTHGLSGIITAPLTAINQMLNNQCSPLTATWKGQTVSFECGYSFWNRLTGFKSFLNIAIDGLLCYRILLKLFKLVERFKNPNDDRVEVMDL